MKKLFLFIVAAVFATSMWAQAMWPERAVDTIPVPVYITDIQFNPSTNQLSFIDNFQNDFARVRMYNISLEYRTEDSHIWQMAQGNPTHFIYTEYYDYGIEHNRNFTSGLIDHNNYFYSNEATAGGFCQFDISNLVAIAYKNGYVDVRIIVRGCYKYADTWRDYYLIDSNPASETWYIINYLDTTLPKIQTLNISAPLTTRYGDQFSITGSFRALSQTTWNIQESTDGVKWDTKKAGSVTADQARAGVDVEYHRVMTDIGVRKVYYRLALRDKTTGIVTYSYQQSMTIKYPLGLNNDIITWGAMGDGYSIPKPADCIAYKISSRLGLDMEDHGSYYMVTLPGCPAYVWEETPKYKVTFLDADYSELSTQEVTCGDDAIAPELPSQAPAKVKGQAQGGLSFEKWSADYTNVHKQLKVFAKYSLDGNYKFKAEQVGHTNSVHPMGFAGDEGRAMVGDSLTFQATITMPAVATLYYETCSRSADGSWTNWTAPTINSVGKFTEEDVAAGQSKAFTQTVPVEYVSNYYEQAWSYGFAFRFYVMCAGQRIYSEPFEFDVFYPTSVRSRIADEQNDGKYETLLASDMEANTGCFVNDSSCMGARYNDTVRIARPHNGEGACVIFSRVIYPDRPLVSGVDDNGMAYFIAPGESEIIDVTVKRYAVVFDNVPGQSQQFDFSAEGLGKYTAYYAQVANCGGKVLAPEEPSIAGYVFKGWEAWDSNIDNDAYLHIPAVSDTYLGFSAVWEALPKPPTYTVYFQDYNGTLLKSEQVERGENATPPSVPARSGYHFTGWDRSYKTVTEHRTLTAQYGVDETTWTVTYYDRATDNDPLEVVTTEIVHDGEAAQGPNLVREGYHFDVWYDYIYGGTADLSHVTRDYEVYAKWTTNDYIITYTMDDAVVMTEKVEYGHMPTAYQAIEEQGKPSTEQYVYTFDHWNPAIEVATKDVTYAAIFAQSLRQYMVTFQNWDHSFLKEEQVEYGKAATAPATPVRSDDYVFIGWDNEFSNVRTNLVVTAQFKLKDKDSEGQGIEDIRIDDEKVQKVLMDGTLYIIRDGKTFNAQGAEVK